LDLEATVSEIGSDRANPMHLQTSSQKKRMNNNKSKSSLAEVDLMNSDIVLPNNINANGSQHDYLTLPEAKHSA